MTLKKLAVLSCVAIGVSLSSLAQQIAPTSGDVVVRLTDPVDFATARPFQSIKASVVSSSNPDVPTGGLAILQVQTRDGSYTLKLVRVAATPVLFKTMSQAGVSTDGSSASGQHTALAAGSMLRFTLTNLDGTPGAPVQQAVTPAVRPTGSTKTNASSLATSSPSSKDRDHFEIEGVALGQTLASLLELAKPFTPKQVMQQGTKTVSFKTKDLSFMVFFSKSGVLNRMSIMSRTKATDLSTLKTAMVSSPTYTKAQQVYGKPDQISGDIPIWNGSGGSTATYQLEEDEIEILTPAN